MRTLVPIFCACGALSVMVKCTGESGLRNVQFKGSSATTTTKPPHRNTAAAVNDKVDVNMLWRPEQLAELGEHNMCTGCLLAVVARLSNNCLTGAYYYFPGYFFSLLVVLHVCGVAVTPCISSHTCTHTTGSETLVLSAATPMCASTSIVDRRWCAERWLGTTDHGRLFVVW